MLTLTNNELTALLNEDAIARAKARTIKNIERRAKTLLTTDGYEMVDNGFTGLYSVFGPKGQHYMVTCDSVFEKHCTCEAFAEYDTCKHYLAVEAKLAEDAMCDEWERFYADTDDDLYPEY